MGGDELCAAWGEGDIEKGGGGGKMVRQKFTHQLQVAQTNC